MLTRRQPFVDALFFATVATVTFEKLHWNFGSDLSLSDVLTALFLVAFALGRLERLDGRFTRSAAVTFAFFVAFLAVYLLGFFNLETATALAQWAKGMVKFILHFLFVFAAVALVARRGERFYWWALAVFCGGMVFNALYGVLQLGVAQTTGANLDAAVLSPLTGGASQINIYGAVEGANVYRPNALTGDPNHLAIEILVPLLVLLPIYLRLERGHRLRVPLMLTLMLLFLIELATISRSGMLGLFCGLLVLVVPYRHLLLRPRFLLPLAGVGLAVLVFVAQRADFFQTVLRSRVDTGGKGTSTHFVVYEFIPQVLSQHPLFGLGLNNFAVYYEFVTGRDNFGPHSFYVALFVETGIVGAVLFLAFLGYVFQRLAIGRSVGRALVGGRGRARRPRAPARVGSDGGARRHDGLELLLPDDELLLLLRLRDARDRGARRLRAAALVDVRVCVLTTSYPRHAGDVAGLFVQDAVEHLRDAGVQVEVVSPASFRHFGIAYGDGIANNLRAEPWRVLLLPLFLLSFALAARRAARDADVVHAHWLPSGIAGLATRKPLVVQLWGSDVELAKRLPWLFRPILRRARIVICASNALAADARALGARDVRVIPSGIDVPERSWRSPRSRHTCSTSGRLSEEKGVLELGGGGAGPAARRRRRRASA